MAEEVENSGGPRSKRPDWRARRSSVTFRLSPAMLALLTLLFGAIGPVTIGVQSCSQIALEKEKARSALKGEPVKQKRELRQKYIELAISSVASPSTRADLLRFLAYNFDDPDLAAWAREGLALDAAAETTAEVQKSIAERCQANCYRAFSETQNEVDPQNRRDVVECSQLCAHKSIDAAFAAGRESRRPGEGDRCIDSCTRSAEESQGKSPEQVRRDLAACAKVCIRTGTRAAAATARASQASAAATGSGGDGNAP